MSATTSTPELNLQTFLRVDPNVTSTVWSRFLEPYLTGAEPVCVASDLPGGIELDDLFARIPELIAREYRASSHRIVLIESATFAALVERGTHTNGQVIVRAASRELADKAIAEVTSWFPLADPPSDSVSVDFWQKSHGMYTTSRTIDAPLWADVRHYYPGEVGDQLDALMDLELDAPDGRVVLWHGPPGTGKTSAIRALARSWRAQARFQVVLDPEPVFSHASSLMEVILDDGDSNDRGTAWRILVIEDADDIVRADNSRTSQSLSRLLNVGDGIVGQGLKVLVLLTTNEPPDRLHPALTRPGRCLSHVAFRLFSQAEAAAAFAGSDLPGSGDLSLAEILTGRCDRDDTPPPGQYL